MSLELTAISHILVLLGGAVTTLVIGVMLPRGLQTWNALPAGLVLAISSVLTAAKLAAPPGEVFDGVYIVDSLTLWSTLCLLLSGLLVLLLSLRSFRGDAREAEFYGLLLLATLGGVSLLGAHDLMQIVLGVLLLSAASYPLVAYRRSDPAALEAALKYYLLGGLLNIGLLYGLVLLYGLSGSTLIAELPRLLDPANERLLAVASVLVIAGLGAKAGYAPAHFWVPDAHQGASVPVAALLATLPKLAGLIALLRVVDSLAGARVDWTSLIAVIAAVTMTWGNLAALRQSDLPRLLGYAGMAQTGYLLLAVVALPHPLTGPSLVLAFLAYLLAMFGAFAVLAATGRRTLFEHRGLWRAQPLLATCMLIALLSLLGIPPLAGFAGKFLLFGAAFEAGHPWLVAIALVNTGLSLYVFVRVLAPICCSDKRPWYAGPVDPVARAVAFACTVASVLIGIFALPFLGALPGLAGP